MGTNYYLQQAENTQPLHIGKSSGGWVFALNTHPKEKIETFEDWVSEMLLAHRIFDEYEHDVSMEEMLKIILQPEPWDTNPSLDFLRRNQAFYDDNLDLLRCKLGDSCIRHGKTYDVCQGEFC